MVSSIQPQSSHAMQRKLTLGYGYMWQGLPEVESNVYIGLTNANLTTDEVIVQLSPIARPRLDIDSHEQVQ